MWQEARKQERKIRGILVDRSKRIQRRKEFYECIKKDPVQFLQLHARPCRIHLEPGVAVAAESPAIMMPWQGHKDNMIDRFDGRAHLDIIPDKKPLSKDNGEALSKHDLLEERRCDFERYRLLIHNECQGFSEKYVLKQIHIEEQFPVSKTTQQRAEEEKKKLVDKRAAIGYNYGDDANDTVYSVRNTGNKFPLVVDEANDDDDDSDISDTEIEAMIDPDELDGDTRKKYDSGSGKYNLASGDFIRFLLEDKEEKRRVQLERMLEEEKAMFPGRKSRRERRQFRERHMITITRYGSPPSYASRKSPEYEPYRSRSRSPSPTQPIRITYITSFGGEDGETSTTTTSQKVGKRKMKKSKGSTVKRNSSSSSSDEASGRKEKLKKNHQKKRKLKSESDDDEDILKRRLQLLMDSDGKANTSNKSGSHSNSSESGSDTHSPSSEVKSNLPTPIESASTKNIVTSLKSLKSRSWSRSPSPSRIADSVKPKTPVALIDRKKMQSRDNREVEQKRNHRSGSSSSESEKEIAERRQKYEMKKTQQHNKSSSHKSQSLDTIHEKNDNNPVGSGKTLTPADRLRIKMQKALNKHYKKDKIAQIEKMEKEEQERQDREDDIREMSSVLRQRERAKRHGIRNDLDYPSSRSSSLSSSSSSRSSRSRSYSPSHSVNKSVSPTIATVKSHSKDSTSVRTDQIRGRSSGKRRSRSSSRGRRRSRSSSRGRRRSRSSSRGRRRSRSSSGGRRRRSRSRDLSRDNHRRSRSRNNSYSRTYRHKSPEISRSKPPVMYYENIRTSSNRHSTPEIKLVDY